MRNIESLSDVYAIRGVDLDFSTGKRYIFRYAIPSKHLIFRRLNENGPEPVDYIAYAKADISHKNQRGRINALGHAKRAIHLVIDQLLYAFGISKAYRRSNFPLKLALLEEIDAFPTHVLGQLNRTRNLIEHKYKDISEEEVVNFTEVAEMFILLTYPYFKNIVKAAYIGVDGDNRCLECEASQKKEILIIQEVQAPLYFNSPQGRIYYNIEHKHKRIPLEEIQLTKANASRWLPYIDLFMYCTKRIAIMLSPPNESSDVRIWEAHPACLSICGEDKLEKSE